MANKHVYIIVEDSRIIVNPETVHVSLSHGESVVWHSPQGQAEISFAREPKGSPFVSERFGVSTGGTAGSGAPIRGKVHQTYKYSVDVTLPNDRRKPPTLDPQVVVDNGA
ncbi:MAG TPA: hypothetical protein VGK93_11660 [Candidatus Eisenbacteria bacterium]|jgi:hypothetical protein